MHEHFFNDFLTGDDTLQVYDGDQLIFSSAKDRLTPLVEYIDSLASYHQQVVILDKIMGNAAALLSVKAGCREVHSPLGSQLAVKTLDKYGIKHYLTEVIQYIQKPGGEDMCPMEKLSLNKDSEEFYQAIINTTP